MQIETLALLQDNYAYLLSSQGDAVVVDPSEAAPVRAALEARGLRLTAIWCTHHHWDHTGGIEALCQAYPGVEVVGSRYDQERGRIAAQTRGVDDGDSLGFGGQNWTVLAIPGHTLGALAYCSQEGHLFTGDTLFLAGCGRVFEGSMAQMHASLMRLAALPPGTEVYCGHEYTEKNLRFALSVDPHNAALQARLQAVIELRARGAATVPAPLSVEVATNPFLRCAAPELAKGQGPVATFTALRAAKDQF